MEEDGLGERTAPSAMTQDVEEEPGSLGHQGVSLVSGEITTTSSSDSEDQDEIIPPETNLGVKT